MFSAAGATGCGGGESESNGPAECPGFSRIVSGGFQRTADHLTWTFELESMPSELVLNRPAVPEGMIDYGYQINVDADGDGEYDHALSLAHDKHSGEAEATTTDILGSTDHDVLRFSGNTGTVVGTFEAGISGNAFTFDLDVSSVPEFASVVSAEQCFWTLVYRFGGLADVCSDRWP